jgi:leucyl-tRNA synthetase
LFKKNLAYKKKMPVNWCPSCKIVLANEEVVKGNCERCGAKVTRKEKEQWLLKITKYAERLIKDLEKVDYPEKVKTLQKDWIGRSPGLEIKFKVTNSQSIDVFTTRPDTIFGCTFLVLAPEHPLIEQLKNKIKNFKLVKRYIEESKKKTERERIAENKEKRGIELKGIKALNPANKKEIPIFVADYVLMEYGKGAIMAVPAHDQRDFDFAKKHNLPFVEVIKNKERQIFPEKAYEGEGILINSGSFSGLKSEIARKKIGNWLLKKKLARKVVYYKLRDWIFSRQRYWGEPIPLIYCRKCSWVPVPEKDLPVKLPEIKDYRPTERGDSPLAKVKNWLVVPCPKCKGLGKRETDVMPNWAGSNWYFLRYCDPKNDKVLADPKKLEYWMGAKKDKLGGVDWYNGGMEHATLHLLYSRFIYKFLWDIGALPKSLGPEPYKKRTCHGIILGEDGQKMSKSRGNIINPDQVVEEYGADAMRLYIMFMGPFDQTIPWDSKGLIGTRRFLEKVWRLSNQNSQKKRSSLYLKKQLHKTIQKVSQDIDSLKFNTAISALMEFVNCWQESKEELAREDKRDFLKILSVFAPYIAEELWERAGFKGFCCQQKWPKISSKFLKEDLATFIIQINGKVRDKVELNPKISQKDLEELALKRPKIQKWLFNRKIKKVIFVPGKLINLVV